MVQIDIKLELLALLEDEEVKSQILKIVDTSFNGRKPDNRYYELTAEIERLKTEKVQIENRLNDVNSKIEPAKEILNLWERIQSLPEKHRRYFNELSGMEDMLAYFSLGRDMAKMKQLHQYIQDAAVGDGEDDETISTLNELLCLCVGVYNYSKRSYEKLEKISVCVDTEFDLNTCIKTSASGNIGCISKVLIQGFGDQEGKIVFKNVVRVS